MNNLFNWLDKNGSTVRGKLLNQLIPIVICTILYLFFLYSSRYFIQDLINPTLQEKVSLDFRLIDVLTGFFLYFLTAIDYALVVGRMQTTNPGSRARVIMNIATVLGCYIGVTAVLFLWGYAKEVTWLIVPILIFAGSVMIKLAFEGLEYFEHSEKIPDFIKKPTVTITIILQYLTRIFTFWMPEVSKPSVEPMSLSKLAKWSFLLPFIIGLDDLIGYMGAMTIYNVFGLLVGIYFADILIDVMIFISPKFTKKVVENAILAFIATFAFLFLAYKSYHESLQLIHERFLISGLDIVRDIIIFFIIVIVADIVVAKVQNRKAYITTVINLRS